MGAFFSGQDTHTLQVEGNDTNCFVSLIVDTRGTYQAAITRKLQIKRETIITDLGSSYEFFGEGSKSLGNSAEKTSSIVNDIIIEYFMLDVTREETNNPFDYLDARFEEIEAAKTKRVSPTIPSTTSTWLPKQKPIEKSRVFSLDEWEPKIPNEEPTLFDKETMQELEVAPSGWYPNKELIHNAIVKMLICCLNINPKGINLRQWITQHMEKVYKNLFESDWNEGPFESWSEFIVEFLVEHYDEDSIPWDYLELEEFFNKVAEAMIAELEEYRALNPYIDKYIDILSRYLIVE